MATSPLVQAISTYFPHFFSFRSAGLASSRAKAAPPCPDGRRCSAKRKSYEDESILSTARRGQ
jgi:hypothetical protein